MREGIDDKYTFNNLMEMLNPSGMAQVLCILHEEYFYELKSDYIWHEMQFEISDFTRINEQFHFFLVFFF